MKRGCVYAIVIFSILSIFFLYTLYHLYDPEFEKIEINQKIGGKLICNSTCYSSIHNWQYMIDYSYEKNNKIYQIGKGTYYAREWKKDEQFVKFDKWFILKTGDWIDNDKVIIGDFQTQKWTDFIFSPEAIEKERIWKEAKIKSLINYSPFETFVTSINNGIIEVSYKFRVNETKSELIDEVKLYYQIDKQTGMPSLISLKK